MAFKTLYSSEDVRYSWEERYDDFREKAADNEIEINKNTLKRYSKVF